MSMTDSKYDDDDDYNECVLVEHDRRKSIGDSPNKLDTIIECVVSIKSEYTPDKVLQQHEATHGTGTIIHANEENIYILTAAHNIIVAQRECNKCGAKTLKKYCGNNNCKQPTTSKTQNFVNADKITFSLRTQSGACIETHQIDDFKCQVEYYKFPTASGGYDIAILIFKCKKKEMVDSYREKCSKFSFINDEYFGGTKSLMHIYGYPYEKMEKRNDGTYYYLWGMGTSKLDGTNKFRVAKNKNTKKLYIENKGIDTTPGQSGSCIYSYNGEDKTRYLIYGVHTGGKSEIQTNYGTFCDIYNIEWITNILDIYNIEWITCHSAFTKGSQELEKKIILLQKQSLQKSQELEKKIILLQKESLQKSQKLEKNALLLKKELEQRKCSPITAIIKLILFIGVIVALIMCGINYNYNWFGRTFTQNETCDEKVYYETIDDALNDNCEMNMTQINDTWCMKYNSMINDCEKLNETKKKCDDDIILLEETIKNMTKRQHDINQIWYNKYELNNLTYQLNKVKIQPKIEIENNLDIFDKNYVSTKHKLENQTLTAIDYKGSSFCKNVISSGIYNWKFKIGKISDIMIFGIWKNQTNLKPPINELFTEDKHHGGYGFNIHDGSLTNPEKSKNFDFYEDHWFGHELWFGSYRRSQHAHRTRSYVHRNKYGIECRSGDTCIVEMMINFDNLTLSYKINNHSYGKAFNIDKHAYKAAVFIFAASDYVQLVH